MSMQNTERQTLHLDGAAVKVLDDQGRRLAGVVEVRVEANEAAAVVFVASAGAPPLGVPSSAAVAHSKPSAPFPLHRIETRDGRSWCVPTQLVCV